MMEKLFMETSGGKMEINPEVVRKYHLEKGTWSPFMRSRIVGQTGEFPAETETEKDPKNSGKKIAHPLEDEPGGVMLTTSEILDFAQGSDSSNGR